MLYNSISEFIFSNLSAITLLIIGIVVEKRYVSRITTFSNSIALIDFLFKIENVHDLLWIYAFFGLFQGVIGLLCYIADEHLPTAYYTVSCFYSSIVIALIMLYYSFFM